MCTALRVAYEKLEADREIILQEAQEDIDDLDLAIVNDQEKRAALMAQDQERAENFEKDIAKRIATFRDKLGDTPISDASLREIAIKEADLEAAAAAKVKVEEKATAGDAEEGGAAPPSADPGGEGAAASAAMHVDQVALSEL